MTVLYDEAAAIKEKEDKKVSIPKARRAARINNTIIAIIAILVGVGAFFLYNWVNVNIFEGVSVMDDGLNVFGITALSFLTAMAFVILLESWTGFGWESGPEWPYYSANVEYHDMVQGKKILKHEIRWSDIDSQHVLWVTMEDKNHVVSTNSIWRNTLKKKVRTDITETTVDLIGGVIYEPYEG